MGCPPPLRRASAVSSEASCHFTVSERRSDCTTTCKSRNQSREAGTSSRIFDSVETSAKCISLGPADYRKRVSNAVWVSPAQVYGGFVHRGCPPAGSGNGTGNKSSVRERGHIICTSLQQGNRVQPVFHSCKEGWRVASHFRSSSSERIRHAAQVQNVNFETNRVTNQIRGLVCHDRTQGRILSYIHSSMSQEVPEVRFWGQSIPISGSSIRPRIITPHFHEMRRCSLGTSSASGYSHYELHRRLVDSSSVASVGSSASRCRSCLHKKNGVTAKCQGRCAFSITEDHFPGRDMGLDVDADVPVESPSCQL